MSDHELLESEVALVQRILQGETELYYQLVRPYRRMIYASAFSILRSEVDAEDVGSRPSSMAWRHSGLFARSRESRLG